VAGVPYVIELETHRLPFLTDEKDESFGKDRRTELGQAFTYPLAPGQLGDMPSVQPAVRAALRVQAGAGFAVAPDFMFTDLDDAWLDVNLRCLRVARMLAGRRPVAAWIHVTLDTVRRGVLASAAQRYAAELSTNSIVVITVSEIDPSLSVADNRAFFEALLAFGRLGLRPIVDRAGETSIPAAAVVAAGYMLGTCRYRTAAPTPIWTHEWNPKVKLKYWEARRGRRVPLETAQRRYDSGKNLQRCAHPDCMALAANINGLDRNLAVRLHNAHAVRDEVLRCRDLGAAATIRWMAKNGLAAQKRWAQALELAIAASEAA
jgi:hypothetical protein